MLRERAQQSRPPFCLCTGLTEGDYPLSLEQAVCLGPQARYAGLEVFSTLLPSISWVSKVRLCGQRVEGLHSFVSFRHPVIFWTPLSPLHLQDEESETQEGQARREVSHLAPNKPKPGLPSLMNTLGRRKATFSCSPAQLTGPFLSATPLPCVAPPPTGSRWVRARVSHRFCPPPPPRRHSSRSGAMPSSCCWTTSTCSPSCSPSTRPR